MLFLNRPGSWAWNRTIGIQPRGMRLAEVCLPLAGVLPTVAAVRNRLPLPPKAAPFLRFAINSSDPTVGGTALPSTVPPPVSSSTALPSVGTGLVYASSCNAAKQSWIAAAGVSVVSTTVYQTSTSSLSYSYPATTTTITDLAPGATPYTLCDGFPRIDGNITISANSSTVTITSWSTYATTSSIYANLSAPVCTIQSADCYALNSSWFSAFDAWASYENTETGPATTPTPTSPPGSFPPVCGSPTVPATTSSVGEAACAENVASVQFLYWPVETASGCDLCSLETCSTMTMEPTISGKPNTAVFWGSTLTSPTVYLALMGTFMYTSASVTTSYDSNFILPQSSAEVSSYCGQIGGGLVAQSVNYADFNYPVPAAAYRCQPSCFISSATQAITSTETYTFGNYTVDGTYTPPSTTTWDVISYNSYATENQCSTIWNNFAPVLSIPSAFTSLSPAVVLPSGVTCPFIFDSDGVFFDPPYALTKGGEAASATLPAGITAANTAIPTTTAAPVLQPSPSLPKETGKSSAIGPTSQSGNPAASAWDSQASFDQLGSIIASAISHTMVNPPLMPAPSTLSPFLATPVRTFTAAGKTFTADDANVFSLNPSATLRAGSQIVISGTTISLASSASCVVVNGVTQSAQQAPTSAGAGTGPVRSADTNSASMIGGSQPSLDSSGSPSALPSSISSPSSPPPSSSAARSARKIIPSIPAAAAYVLLATFALFGS